jgi:hypothetical protein
MFEEFSAWLEAFPVRMSLVRGFKKTYRIRRFLIKTNFLCHKNLCLDRDPNWIPDPATAWIRIQIQQNVGNPDQIRLRLQEIRKQLFKLQYTNIIRYSIYFFGLPASDFKTPKKIKGNMVQTANVSRPEKIQ